MTHVCAQSLSHVRPFGTPWTGARQAPLPTVFSRQEHWSGLPCPPSGDLPNPGIKPRSPTLQATSLLSEPPGKHSKSLVAIYFIYHSVYIVNPNLPNLPLLPLSPGNHKFVFYISDSTSVLVITSFVPSFFLRPHIEASLFSLFPHLFAIK